MDIGLRAAAALGAAIIPLTVTVQPLSAAAASRSPVVQFVGQIDRQDVVPQRGSEPDTLVEPDIAASPINPNVAVAVAHDGRFPDGGAVAIGYAWTHDGGASWHHAPLPHLTKSTGGRWDRASDPVVAFGTGGEVFVSTLVFDSGCGSGVAVSRSTDGGATFGDPVLAESSGTCDYSDDKNWLIVDTQPHSRFHGRVYQFWTPFLTINGNPAGSPQVVRWSDDHGAHWSDTSLVSGGHEGTQNSQPMVAPDGTLTDVFLGAGTSMVATTSHDGGETWSSEVLVANSVGGGPNNIRCCLPAAAADPVTGQMYAVWENNGPGNRDPVELSTSSDGRHWSAARTVSRDGSSATIQHVNVAVTAYGGRVFVTYGTRDTAVDGGELVQQELSSSYDGGRTFGTPLQLGPPSDLHWAAFAGGKFPGDYVGASATATRVVVAWCASSRPQNPSAKYHQTLYAAVLRP